MKYLGRGDGTLKEQTKFCVSRGGLPIYVTKYAGLPVKKATSFSKLLKDNVIIFKCIGLHYGGIIDGISDETYKRIVEGDKFIKEEFSKV